MIFIEIKQRMLGKRSQARQDQNEKDMTKPLSSEQLASIRASYFNILALFLEQEKVDSRYIRCLIKWGIQLRITPDDLTNVSKDISTMSYSADRKIDRLEAIYHLVYMIFLDRVVEDNELEVATIYAEKLGFKREIVSELFTSIVTADADRSGHWDPRTAVVEFMKIHDQG